MRRPFILRRCKNGHTYRVVYGDERMHRGSKFICIECPKKTNDEPVFMLDMVIDPALADVNALRRRIRES